MLTGTMVEIGSLMIIMAVSLQILLGLRSVFSRSPQGVRLDRTQLKQPDASAALTLTPADGSNTMEPASWLGTRKFQVAMRMHENEVRDICSFYLVPLDRRPFPPFRPGQFLTFELPAADGGRPVVRCYSLSDGPNEREYYRISVKRLTAGDVGPPGLSSNHFHDHVGEGEVVDAYAPAGEFYLDQDSDRPVVLIAGGVGLTPLLSMVNWLTTSRPDREIWLFYGVRNRAEHAWYDHLARLRKECPNLKMFIAYSRPSATCRRGVDYNVDGHITVELLQEVLSASNYEFYLCGPPAMMTTIRHDLAVWGVPAADVRFEAFGGPPDQTDDAGDSSQDLSDVDSFQVRFARSDRVALWTGNADTLLELAEANGIKMRCSCRAGNCGTCLTALRRGAVEYIHPPAREHDEGACLPCIARPRSDVVLDI